jgi:(p)ppGpp synthase/HD superfamily hydrolase
VGLACELHGKQARNDEGVPYVAHLLAVAALVLEDGGTEDEAIAALLHDAAEDQGGRPTLARIEDEFGPDIAAIVEGCSDTLEVEVPGAKKPDWRPRKEAYVAHLATASPSVRRVAAADKLHNLTGLLDEVHTKGVGAFERFDTSTPRDQAWFYKACASALVAKELYTRLATRVLEGAQRLDDAVNGLAGR